MAKTIQGTNDADYLDGTPRADDIAGRNGDHKIIGGEGRACW